MALPGKWPGHRESAEVPSAVRTARRVSVPAAPHVPGRPAPPEASVRLNCLLSVGRHRNLLTCGQMGTLYFLGMFILIPLLHTFFPLNGKEGVLTLL